SLSFTFNFFRTRNVIVWSRAAQVFDSIYTLWVLVKAAIAIAAAGYHYTADRKTHEAHNANLLATQFRLQKDFPQAQQAASAGHLHTLDPLHVPRPLHPHRTR